VTFRVAEFIEARLQRGDRCIGIDEETGRVITGMFLRALSGERRAHMEVDENQTEGGVIRIVTLVSPGEVPPPW